jgi:hypothetical protein
VYRKASASRSDTRAGNGAIVGIACVAKGNGDDVTAAPWNQCWRPCICITHQGGIEHGCIEGGVAHHHRARVQVIIGPGAAKDRINTWPKPTLALRLRLRCMFGCSSLAALTPLILYGYTRIACRHTTIPPPPPSLRIPSSPALVTADTAISGQSTGVHTRPRRRIPAAR